MKKTVAAIILVSFFLNILGYHLFYYVCRQEAKMEMKEFLGSHFNQNDITVLSFSSNDETVSAKMKWENSKEFNLNGEMYDVVEQKTENGKLIIRCINDKQESRLLNDYEKINRDSQNDPSPKNQSTVLLRLITIPFEIPGPLSFSITKDEMIRFSKPFRNNISSGIKDILTPPPQIS